MSSFFIYFIIAAYENIYLFLVLLFRIQQLWKRKQLIEMFGDVGDVYFTDPKSVFRQNVSGDETRRDG